MNTNANGTIEQVDSIVVSPAIARALRELTRNGKMTAQEQGTELLAQVVRGRFKAKFFGESATAELKKEYEYRVKVLAELGMESDKTWNDYRTERLGKYQEILNELK